MTRNLRMTLDGTDLVGSVSDYSDWEINRRREESGMRPISPTKDFRVGSGRRADMTWEQIHGYRGWSMPHNRRRKPIRKPKALAR